MKGKVSEQKQGIRLKIYTSTNYVISGVSCGYANGTTVHAIVRVPSVSVH